MTATANVKKNSGQGKSRIDKVTVVTVFLLDAFEEWEEEAASKNETTTMN